MSESPSALERPIEMVLTAGLLVSGGFLLAGLLAGRPGLLRWGILLLMMTPVSRTVVVTVGLIRSRDWLFSLISLWVLAVLASSLYVALRIGMAR